MKLSTHQLILLSFVALVGFAGVALAHRASNCKSTRNESDKLTSEDSSFPSGRALV